MASETRKRVLDMAVQDKLTLIGYHFAFPGIGNVAKEGDCLSLRASRHGYLTEIRHASP